MQSWLTKTDRFPTVCPGRGDEVLGSLCTGSSVCQTHKTQSEPPAGGWGGGSSEGGAGRRTMAELSLAHVVIASQPKYYAGSAQ